MKSPIDKLHDFYQPPPPSWMPQTIGWYVVFAVIAFLFFWLIIHYLRLWLANRYRREALRKLKVIPASQLSELLKHTALLAWPRENVASLTGLSWLSFLNESAKEAFFQTAPANRIEEIALREETLSKSDERALREAATEWIRRHRVQA